MRKSQSEAEKRYDQLSDKSREVVDTQLDRTTGKKLSDAELEELSAISQFFSTFSFRCEMKANEIANQRRKSGKLKDRFMSSVGLERPSKDNPEIVRVVKEETLGEYDAYHAKLDYFRQQGATEEKVAEEGSRFRQQLRDAKTSKEDSNVYTLLALKMR